MKNIPLFNRKDIVLILILLLIAGAVALFGSFSVGAQTATVTSDGETVTVIDLKTAENETFTVNGTVIEVKDGTIRFADSNCGDKTCVRTGVLEKSGDAAACVPNKVAIKIDSSRNDGIDIVVY